MSHAASEQDDRAGARRLVSGVFWNGLGRGLPLLLALALTPFLIELMGLERWGLFTLALAMVGVFGVFDLGVGPALTRAIAERMATHAPEELSRLAGAAMLCLVAFAALMAALLWFALPALLTRLLNVPPELQAEALAAFRILAAAAPLVVLNAALWGVLAAHQKFASANLVSIPVSAMYYLGPLLVLLVWQSLVGVMLVLVACRLANTLSYAWLARPLLPGFSVGRVGQVWPLLRVGGWMTASSVLNQFLLYSDRFVIGSLLTLAAVAHYATPLDLVLRMWIVPVAVAQALLPAMASSFRERPEAVAALARRGALIVAALTLPPCLVVAAEGDRLLGLWLGPAFAAEGGSVLRILGLGIFLSCAAFVPDAVLNAIARPDVAAKLALAQIAVFLPLSALLLWLFGIEGAAVAWSLRAGADLGGKWWFAARLYPAAATALRGAGPVLVASVAGLAALLAFDDPTWLAALGAVALLAAAVAIWRALSAEERGMLRRPRAFLRGESAA